MTFSNDEIIYLYTLEMKMKESTMTKLDREFNGSTTIHGIMIIKEPYYNVRNTNLYPELVCIWEKDSFTG